MYLEIDVGIILCGWNNKILQNKMNYGGMADMTKDNLVLQLKWFVSEGYSVKCQGSHKFHIRGRSNFSFRELTDRSGRQTEKEVGRLLGVA
jgi:hypothetical protein